MFSRLICCTMPLILAASASGTVVVLIADQEMMSSHWEIVEINNVEGGFTGAANQELFGGNPGAYRRVSHSSQVSPAAGWLVHAHIQTWNPAMNGEITSFDMGIDVNCLDGGTSGAVLFGLIMVQNGYTFYGPTFTPLTNSGWRTDLQLVGLTNDDFLNVNSEPPDFSSSGAPLRFGFYTSNGTNSGVPINAISGADNFNVVLTIKTSCDADLSPAPNGDGTVGVPDLLAIINTWGTCQPRPAACPADLNNDQTVGVPDLLAAINQWGACP